MSEPNITPSSECDATTKADCEGVSTDSGKPHAVLRPPLDQIGNYRLVAQLGSGGMGEVWLAQHIENQNLQAAVKFIRADHLDLGIQDRFQQERELLVRLRHENIVRVYDLGVSPNGTPYFVMEYVDGAPLDVYCDTRRLSVRRRLELFLQVCRAVQHAHGQGLIHRDLKPANILVTEAQEKGSVRAVAKVIDFGIARALESGEAVKDAERKEESPKESLLTQTGMFIGSLLYASPEQLLTLPIDVRTDVYSLGIILYKMLSGTIPITAKEAQEMLREAKSLVLERYSSTSRTPPSEKVRTVGKTDPKRLAHLAEVRGVLANELAALLVHELDWITLKAIEAERERRYWTVEAFASDVERYLKDEIVEARRPDWKYRAGKIWRRQRRTIVAVFLLTMVLFGSLVAVRTFERKANSESKRAIDQQRQAEEQRRLAEEYAKKAEAAAERERTTDTLFTLPSDVSGHPQWRLIKINGRDFVYMDDLAKFYGFPAVKRDTGNFETSAGKRKLNGSMDSSELLINNLKFNLSFSIIDVQGALLMSRMDLSKIIEPVLRPQKIANAEKIETVVLDPAGGGSEGATSPHVLEKEFTLDVANKTRLLLANQSYKVVLTRTDDTEVSDNNRVRIANSYPNALFISIHLGSREASDAGIETYNLAPQGVPSMVEDGYSGEALDAQAGNVNDAQNMALATAVHASVVFRAQMYDNGIKRARFVILRDSKIPAVVIRCGFLSNEDDAKVIATGDFRQKTAECIADAVKNYRRAIGPLSSKVPAQGNTPPPKVATPEENKTPEPSSPPPKQSSAPNLPPELAPLAQEAKDQFNHGDYLKAEEIYRKILATAPDNIYTLSNLGVALFHAQKFKEAGEVLSKAIVVKPKDAFSHRTLGMVLYQEGKYDDAIDEMTKTLVIDPKNATAYNYLGISHSQEGQTDLAMMELKEAIALDSNYADAHYNLAVVLASKTPPEKENARKFYKRAIELGAEMESSLEALIDAPGDDAGSSKSPAPPTKVPPGKSKTPNQGTPQPSAPFATPLTK